MGPGSPVPLFVLRRVAPDAQGAPQRGSCCTAYATGLRDADPDNGMGVAQIAGGPDGGGHHRERATHSAPAAPGAGTMARSRPRVSAAYRQRGNLTGSRRSDGSSRRHADTRLFVAGRSVGKEIPARR